MLVLHSIALQRPRVVLPMELHAAAVLPTRADRPGDDRSVDVADRAADEHVRERREDDGAKLPTPATTDDDCASALEHDELPAILVGCHRLEVVHGVGAHAHERTRAGNVAHVHPRSACRTSRPD